MLAIVAGMAETTRGGSTFSRFARPGRWGIMPAKSGG